MIDPIKEYDNQIVCASQHHDNKERRFTNKVDYDLHYKYIHGVMTGQEWLDRFNKIFQGTAASSEILQRKVIVKQAFEAAKKAAGL